MASAPANSQVAAIIVTYDSERVIGRCLEALAAQTRAPDLVIIVDNHSPDRTYLDALVQSNTIKLIQNDSNVGFCNANNIGFNAARGHKYVLFLNPDAFLHSDFVERALSWMDRPENADVAILTGTLLGYDISNGCPTGAVDSTGVFQKWYGKWYDRDQGSRWSEPAGEAAPEQVPAICGALMFCRTRALEHSLLYGRDVFDSKFFMYKEDIDLSVRLRRNGWRLIHMPTLLSFHCRGWQGRAKMPERARLMSAKNELRVSLRNNGRGIAYSLLKRLFVPLENALHRASKNRMRNK